MKDYLQVQKDRINYHFQPLRNTVHRSSLTAPNLPGANTWISFINHFLMKRGYKSIALKLSAIDNFGNLLDSQTILIKEPKVYSFNLNEIFSDFKINNFLIDFYSERNLFVPFPAVIISHLGKDFCNTVHSYNRVLNDVFEDDKINKNHVSEASFDLKISNKYDTFFNLSSGISNLTNEIIQISYERDKLKIKKTIKVSLPRLSFRRFFLSKILSKKLEGGIIKIRQPKQKLFYGRMLAGRLNKKTKAFCANHSYYDSSGTQEYFHSSQSYRTYPYFENYTNQITMYPVFSPSNLDIKIKVLSKGKEYVSPNFKFSSNSSKPLNININNFVDAKKLKDVTAFTVIADTKRKKIPTRLNHQLIYGAKNTSNSLQCSINVSLTNDKVFIPKKKSSFVWGQIISHKSYDSKLGLCFKDLCRKNRNLKITFFNDRGVVKSFNKTLNSNKSLLFDINKVFKNSKKFNFFWYTAKSKEPHLSAYSFHINKISGNSSGEHNF